MAIEPTYNGAFAGACAEVPMVRDHTATLTDEALMLHVRKGNVALLGLLFERHHVCLFNYFLRLTANRPASDDLVQDVFVRILRYRRSYRKESKFKTWMFSIANNVSNDHFKREKRVQAYELKPHNVAIQSPDSQTRVELSQEAELLHRAMARLSPKLRKTLVLSRFSGLTCKEAAAALGCRVGTVKANIHRGLKQLAKHYEELTEVVND